MEQFRAALKVRPGDAEAGLLARRAEIGGKLARVKELDRSGQREEAVAAMLDLRARSPDDEVRAAVEGLAKSLNEQGEVTLKAERFRRAVPVFELIQKLRPDDPAVGRKVDLARRFSRAVDLILSGDRPGAITAFDELRNLAPEDAAVKALGEIEKDPRRPVTDGLGMKLVLVPTGVFLMGSNDGDDDEKPWHWVRITRPLYLGATEVTRGQFRRFVDETRYRTEAERAGDGTTWRDPGFEQTDEHPVIEVSWNDAVAFCEWLSREEGATYRLPTEAEWEYACRAGTRTAWSTGDDPAALPAVANLDGGVDGYDKTAPVGHYKPNPKGLFDMHGNVWEWCSDWYAADYYQRSPQDDPSGPAGASVRVLRGGSWDYGPRRARSAHRVRLAPSSRLDYLGFRVARVQSAR